MRVMTCGDLNWGTKPEHVEIVKLALEDLTTDSVVSNTASKGADTVVNYGWANRWGRALEKHPADWKRSGNYYDRSAGYKATETMIQHGGDVLYAFVIRDATGNYSRLVAHAVSKALEAGVPVHIFEEDGSMNIVMPDMDKISVNKHAIGVNGEDIW